MASGFENPEVAILKDVVSTLVSSMGTVKFSESESRESNLMSFCREEA